MHHLEHVHVASDRDLVDVRFPVQYVVRPKSDEFHDYRGYAGQVAGGVLKPGDEVVVLPSGMTSTIQGIDLFDEEIAEAFPPMSVTVRLDDDVDVSRGDMIARVNNAPKPSQDIDAMICWMTNEPLRPRQKLADQAHDAHRAGDGQGHPVPPRRQQPAPRPGHQGARSQRDRPRPAAHHRAAAVRPVLEEPHHGLVHPDRRGDRRHRRRRHDQQRQLTRPTQRGPTGHGRASLHFAWRDQAGGSGPDLHPVDVHVLRQLVLAVEVLQLVVGAEQAEDEELGLPGDALR